MLYGHEKLNEFKMKLDGVQTMYSCSHDCTQCVPCVDIQTKAKIVVFAVYRNGIF